MLKITPTLPYYEYQSHTMAPAAHAELAAIMERKFPGVPFLAFEMLGRHGTELYGVPVRFAELNGNTDALCDDQPTGARVNNPLAIELTDRILNGIIVHGFENDASVETAVKSQRDRIVDLLAKFVVSPTPVPVWDGTAGGDNEPLPKQTERLARYITENFPGEPSQNQGAIDTAIRLLDELRTGNRIEFPRTHDHRYTVEPDRFVEALIVAVTALQRIGNTDRAMFASEEPLNVAHTALAQIFPRADKVEPVAVDNRPANCRNRLASEGKPYPRSGCQHCNTGGMTGCPFERGK